jgi:hypothetical protein
MTVLRALIGLALGFGIAFGTYYGLTIALSSATSVAIGSQSAGDHKAPPKHGTQPGRDNHKPASQGNSKGPALIVGLICGALGGLYGLVAFGKGIYGFGPLSILGFILDVSWSLLNAVASLVWVLVCTITGSGFVDPTPDSKRSGTFVYKTNPRGGGYDATTIGTAIAGGWCSHEETHVWQARIFGPLYMPVYVTSLALNLVFRLITGKTKDVSQEAYYRICFEDWAYAAGAVSGDEETKRHINWGLWFLWFFLSTLYVSFPVAMVAGFATKMYVVGIVATGGLVVYSLIRALLARWNHSDSGASSS